MSKNRRVVRLTVEAKINQTAVRQIAQACIQSCLAEEGEKFSLTVSGHCMTPTLQNKCLVTLVSKKRYRAGDIIVYDSDHLHEYVVHRMLGRFKMSNKFRCFIKADNNFSPDALVDEDSILGCVVGVPVTFWQRAKAFMCFCYWFVVTSYKKVLNGFQRK